MRTSCQNMSKDGTPTPGSHRCGSGCPHRRRFTWANIATSGRRLARKWRARPDKLVSASPSATSMEFVEHLKSSVDIVKVVGEYVRLKKVGGTGRYTGLCP